MARGWESKSVEAQQEDAARGRAGGASSRPLSEEERTRFQRRATLELARKRTAADLMGAVRPPERAMLERALAALDTELKSLDG